MKDATWLWWFALAAHLGGTTDLYPANPQAARCYWSRINGGSPAGFDRAPYLN